MVGVSLPFPGAPCFCLPNTFIPFPFQLQHLVQDESCVAVSDAYKEARGMMRTSGGTPLGGIALESVYQKKVEQALADENCFKVITVRIGGERGLGES